MRLADVTSSGLSTRAIVETRKLDGKLERLFDLMDREDAQADVLHLKEMRDWISWTIMHSMQAFRQILVRPANNRELVAYELRPDPG